MRRVLNNVPSGFLTCISHGKRFFFQELIMYLAMFIRSSPALFDDLLRLRVGLIIQVSFPKFNIVFTKRAFASIDEEQILRDIRYFFLLSNVLREVDDSQLSSREKHGVALNRPCSWISCFAKVSDKFLRDACTTFLRWWSIVRKRVPFFVADQPVLLYVEIVSIHMLNICYQLFVSCGWR